ncbi:MAG: peptidoglycan DD-metalloendopeptidase family protein [Oscillospiraceae bacterium]|nr:peptidoglycan DD-metalloendopeptidase family protein [Oscillospiraceae bacterium]
MNKSVIRVIAVILAVILVVTILLGIISVPARAVTQDDIDALISQEEEISQRKEEIRAKIDSYEFQQMAILERVETLNQQMFLTEEDIENIKQRIELYGTLIADKKEAVAEAQKAEEAQLTEYKRHVRSMEEAGPLTYLSVIFEAASFPDLLGRLDFIKQIMNEDERQYKRLTAAKESTAAAVGALEKVAGDQQAEQKLLEEKEAQLQSEIEESQNMLKEIEGQIDSFQALYQEEEAARLELEQQIAELQEELERQQQACVQGSGRFVWPATSYIVTSTFGTRLHPVYGYYLTHYGVDIGAGYGTEVYAADSGTVIASEYSSSYGYYIVIDHGNGYTTLYGHMSTLIASVGEGVSQGEVIGLIGSTGVSTGPHLHFEVRDYGVCIDPLDFFSGYEIWE